ncbi:MAG TPA: SRPBCC family protein [Acidimicrobiales bacterium]|nr:SRPBCC family protein [Acidimicrobiales bacterium]
MPAEQRFSAVADSSAPPEACFALIADATTWRRWAGPMIGRSDWDPAGGEPPGVGAVRRLGRPPFVTREEIVAYEPPTHHAYVLRRGLPVRAYRADVELRPVDGGTRIEWSAVFEPRWPGTGRLLAFVLSRTVRGFARRVAKAAPGP